MSQVRVLFRELPLNRGIIDSVSVLLNLISVKILRLVSDRKINVDNTDKVAKAALREEAVDGKPIWAMPNLRSEKRLPDDYLYLESFAKAFQIGWVGVLEEAL